MKKQIKNIILTILVAVTASMTFSCAGATDPLLNGKPDKVQYNGKKPSEAMNYVGNISKIYKAVSKGRFANGDIFHNYDSNIGITAVYEGKLIEYNDMDDHIKNYITELVKEDIDKKRKAVKTIHQFYNVTDYSKTKKYVEFSTFTDIDRDKVIAYDLNMFFEDTENPDKIWKSKHVRLSPDLTIDLDRKVNIITKERAYYEYPYAKK